MGSLGYECGGGLLELGELQRPFAVEPMTYMYVRTASIMIHIKNIEPHGCWPGENRENSPFYRQRSPGGGVPLLPPVAPDAALAAAEEADAEAATAAATVPE